MLVGPDTLLNDTPRTVELDEENYILTQNLNGNPVLFSTQCPHRGGKVKVDDECLHCPWHDWKFDSQTGEVTEVADENSLSNKDHLTEYDVFLQDGSLYADIPDNNPIFNVSNDLTELPSIEVLAHATLQIEYNEFTLVTDPWLEGPAFIDGWTQYPPPTCDIDKVAKDTDAIWVTHDHPDHLNPRTLDRFDKSTPVYVPELNERRLSNRLYDLDFKNVHSLPTGKPYQLTEDVEAICFESRSTFNDSILVLNLGGFKILNAHDAGVNWDVTDAVPEVDMVANEFTAGAGDYPVKWDQVGPEETREIIKERNEMKIEECELLVDLFDADYLLPFAKFMERPHPQHKSDRDLLEKNRPSDIVNHFDNKDVEILDLIPGERWCGESENIQRRNNRTQFFDDTFKEQYLQTRSESMEPVADNTFDLSHGELETYFETMSGSELASEVGDFALTLLLTGDNREITALIRFCDGKVQYRPTDEPVPLGSVNSKYHVSMRCPGVRMQFMIRNNRSWDDLQYGWWAEFDRQPDHHNRCFRRLTHAPWEAHEDTMRVAEGYDIETDIAKIPIAELIEKYGVEDILSDYGLYCVGCPQGMGEDIVEAARIHGLDPDMAQKLISNVEKEIPAKGLTGD
jgi:CMP-N-acetylneuraminate monooxygenase